MLLESQSGAAPTQDSLARYEKDCFAFYVRCGAHDLQTELEDLLRRLVGERRELHRALTEREVHAAEQALSHLLYLEAQIAALRRVHDELGLHPVLGVSGPQDRRPERRRTART